MAKAKTIKKTGPGGKRDNAGRPKGEPTKAIGKRVPVRFYNAIIKVINIELTRLLKEEKK